MVSGWTIDLINRNITESDACLQNIHRWISSGESQFYDPYLSKMLSKLMRRVYSIFINALMARSAKIVYSNLSKIIIDTGKYNLEEATNYI